MMASTCACCLMRCLVFRVPPGSIKYSPTASGCVGKGHTAHAVVVTC